MKDHCFWLFDVCRKKTPRRAVWPDFLAYHKGGWLPVEALVHRRVKLFIQRLFSLRLMPVAKESFHAWQNIASAMYDKDT